MGSSISVNNNTTTEFVCYFTLIGGGRPACGYKEKTLKLNGVNEAEFSLSLPICIVVYEVGKPEKLFKMFVKSPPVANEWKYVSISSILDQKKYLMQFEEPTLMQVKRPTLITTENTCSPLYNLDAFPDST